MKLKKILAAAAASVLAIGTMAVSASANFYKPEGELDPSLIINEGSYGMWLIQLYNTGNPAENKPAVDRNLDVTKIASLTAYIDIVPVEGYTYEDYDPSIDGFGGGMIWSANGGDYGTSDADELFKKYNWPSGFNTWWGIPDKEDTYEGRPADQVDENGEGGEGTNTGTCSWNEKIHMNYIRDFAYSLTMEVPDEFRWIPGAGCHQVGLQEWGNDEYFLLNVVAFTVNDDDGNVLVAFDELGNEIDDAKLKEIVDNLSKPAEGDTPADTNDNNAENTAAGDENTAATEETPSDANTTSSTTTDSSSSTPPNNSNVGLIIGIVAGVVVIGGGIGVVSFLRKK